ncbi:MAG: hypothetical protein SPJ27_07755 [Candidatus Onthovivens sp.]|nr:hypothetical protein [Candidatus Onthovivens sp.]
MKILVKNKLGKDKTITLANGEKYLLKNGEQKIIGDYLDSDNLIYKLLTSGLNVSKIEDENIKPEMII